MFIHQTFRSVWSYMCKMLTKKTKNTNCKYVVSLNINYKDFLRRQILQLSEKSRKVSSGKVGPQKGQQFLMKNARGHSGPKDAFGELPILSSPRQLQGNLRRGVQKEIIGAK